MFKRNLLKDISESIGISKVVDIKSVFLKFFNQGINLLIMRSLNTIIFIQ